MNDKVTEFEDELYGLFSDPHYIDEPAGHGCGYGITPSGEKAVRELITNFLKGSEDMNENGKLYEVALVTGTDILRVDVVAHDKEQAKMKAIAENHEAIKEDTKVSVRVFQSE
jgi:hypothetical protein